MEKPIQHIGKDALKITFIQTLPGAEISVAQQLKKACERFQGQGVKNYTFSKAFGGYDIILAYRTDDYEASLVKYGPIQGILKSITFLCFDYLWTDHSTQLPDPIHQIHNFNCTAFVLIKLKPKKDIDFIEIEKNYLSLVSKIGLDHCSFVGTLGWDELILLISNDNIESLLNHIFKLSYDSEVFFCEACPLKTLSYISINYPTLFGPNWDQLEMDKLNTAEFETILSGELSKNQGLNRIIHPSINSTIEISFEPIYSPEIKQYWRGLKYEIFDAMGETDLIVKPSIMDDLSWAKHISDIVIFRLHFRSKLHSTNTFFNVTDLPLPNKTSISGNPHIPSPPLIYSYEDLTERFSEEYSPILATQLYSLNSLSQDPIFGPAFLDMQYYPYYLLAIGSDRLRKNKSSVGIGLSAAESISLGCELRSYGIYGNVEGKLGRFSKLRGGVQRAIQALEFFPRHVLNRCGLYPWAGFVNVSEEPFFFQLNEIIFLPQDALWDPRLWATFWHEISHIIIERDDAFISPNVPVIRAFLADKKNSDAWMKHLIELAADIIGYEIGFCQKYDLFLKTWWNYLIKVKPLQEAYFPLEIYLFRTFFVELWDRLFNRNGNSALSITEFRNESTLHLQFNLHIDKIERITGIKSKDRDFIITRNTPFIKNLENYIMYLNQKIRTIEAMRLCLRSKPEWLSEGNSLEIAETILSGQVYYFDIKYPEAVLCHILEKYDSIIGSNKDMKFIFAIAAILTFCNAQSINLLKMPNASEIFTY